MNKTKNWKSNQKLEKKEKIQTKITKLKLKQKLKIKLKYLRLKKSEIDKMKN